MTDPSSDPRPPTLVVCALETERRALAGLERPGVEIHVCGMGAESAAAFAATAFRREIRAVIATGFCGALSPSLEVGDVIAADPVVHENTGEAFPADALLIAAAPGRRGTLVSAAEVARTPADRAALHGLAVDLESATLARAAAEAEVPFVALRVVSDRYRDRIPDLCDLIDSFGRPRSLTALIWHVARRPRDAVRLILLRRASRRAGSAMHQAVATLLDRLGTSVL